MQPRRRRRRWSWTKGGRTVREPVSYGRTRTTAVAASPRCAPARNERPNRGNDARRGGTRVVGVRPDRPGQQHQGVHRSGDDQPVRLVRSAGDGTDVASRPGPRPEAGRRLRRHHRCRTPGRRRVARGRLADGRLHARLLGVLVGHENPDRFPGRQRVRGGRAGELRPAQVSAIVPHGNPPRRPVPPDTQDAPERRGRSTARNRTRPPFEEIRPPAKSQLTFLRCTAGRSNGSRLSSVMAGVALLLLGKKDASTTNFYPITTTYATFAITPSRRHA